MRTIAFGPVTVTTAGTPVRLGASTLAANLGAHDTQLSVADANPFTTDMLPFLAKIEDEIVMVTAMTSTTFTVVRGAESTTPVAHTSTKAIVAHEFRICEALFTQVAANTNPTFVGSQAMATGGAVGTIRRLAKNAAATTPDDKFHFQPQDDKGNPGLLTDWVLDVTTSNEKILVSAWVR